MLSPWKLLAVSSTFWLAVVLFVVGVGCRLLAGGRPGALDSALRHMRALLTSTAVLTGMSALTLPVAAFAVYMNYVAPWDVMQDIASARQILRGETAYPVDLGPLIRTELRRDAPRVSLGRWFPSLREKEANETGGFLSRQAHPPLLILLHVPPTALFSARGAALAADLLSLALYVVMLWLLCRAVLSGIDTRMVLLLAVAGLGWSPIVDTLRQGQSGLVIAAVLVSAWYCLRSDRPVAAGVFVGLAVCLKLYPGLLLVYLAARLRRALVSAVVTILLCVAATGLVLGWSVFQEYLTVAQGTSTAFGGSPLNVSFPALLGKNGVAVNHVAWMAIGVTLVGVCLWFMHRPLAATLSRELLDLEYSLFLIAALLISPVTWNHYFPSLLLPLVVTARLVVSNRPGWGNVLPLLVFLVLFAIPVDTLVFWFANQRSPQTVSRLGASLPNVFLAASWLSLLSFYAGRAADLSSPVRAGQDARAPGT